MPSSQASSGPTTRLAVRFGSATIDTTVTRDAAAADEWVRAVRADHHPRGGGGGPLIVGLDCEWKPNYRSWTTSRVAVLQLCAGARCLVLQLPVRRPRPGVRQGPPRRPRRVARRHRRRRGRRQAGRRLRPRVRRAGGPRVPLQRPAVPLRRRREAGAQRLRQGGAGAWGSSWRSPAA